MALIQVDVLMSDADWAKRTDDRIESLRTLGGPGSGRYPKGSGQNSAEFRAWFGRSKVVNPDGSPMVVYHSTISPDIEAFKKYTHFGTQEAANQRAETLYEFSHDVVKRDTGSPNVLPVFLSIQNPVRIPDLASINQRGEDYDAEADAAEDKERESEQDPRNFEAEGDLISTLYERDVIDRDEFWEHQYDSTEEAFALLESKGYDGIVYENVVEDAGQDSWIAFRPEQVKSAIGNRGTYDPKNPLITAGYADQPREPSGSPVGGRFTSRTVYHGTQSAALASIKEHGLSPTRGIGTGADEYARQEGADMGGRPASVYVIDSELSAEKYAKYAAEVNEGVEPIILKIEIPNEFWDAHVRSEDQGDAWAFKKDIPPEWIKGVAVVEPSIWYIPEWKTLASVGRVVYSVVLIKDDLRIAGRADQPREPAGTSEGGQFASTGTQVGITSARPGASDKQVEAAMHEFADKLKLLPGVTNVSVKKGTGIFFGVAEPTWVTAYTGNGAARRLLAKTAERHNQDSVLVMKAGSSDAAVELTFDQKIGVNRRPSIMKMMEDRGIVGGTWYTHNGRTVLRMASVQHWGIDKTKHVKATEDLTDYLSSIGTRSVRAVHEISTEVIENKDYARVQRGLASGVETNTSGTRRDGAGIPTDRSRRRGTPGERGVPGRPGVRAVTYPRGSGGRTDDSEGEARGLAFHLSQSVVDCLQSNAKQITDLFESVPRGTHSEGDRKIPLSVVPHVLNVTNNQQVLRTIVSAIPVDMVNFLSRKQVTPHASIIPEINPNSELFRALGGPGSGRYPKGSGGVNNSAFRKWFSASKVVNSDGTPKVVYHGTTHNIESFHTAGDPKLNPESDWGSGVYFTSEQEDLGENYAGEGPDLTQRIEGRAEQIENDSAVEDEQLYRDGKPGYHMSHEEALRRARYELIGSAGAISMPVYLNIQNPFVLGMGSDPDHPVTETFLTMESTRIDPNDEDSDYNEPTGTLVDFVEALRSETTVGSQRDVNAVEEVVQRLMEKGMDGGLSASELSETVRGSEAFGYMEDVEGRLIAHEVFRRALETVGFDGVIDRTVWSKFGKGKQRGGMTGMSPATVHYVAFKPTQIKSAIGNRGTYDPVNPLITAGLRTAAPIKKKIRPFDLEFSHTNPDVIEWAEAHAAELIKGITETTAKNIHDAVVRSFEEGDRTIAEREILDAVGDKTRAKIIAHNESMVSASEGQRQSWQQAIDEGLLTPDVRRIWIATSDSVVCPICAELDGKTATLYGEYPEPGGDGPVQHVGCRCTEGISK